VGDDMTFEEDLAAAVAAPVETQDVEVLLNARVLTLRFRQMDGFEWADETDRHPARPDTKIDMHYGYNLRSLTKAVAPKTGVRVDGDGEHELTEEQWTALLKALSGAHFQRVCDAVFALNEYAPAWKIRELKKGSRAGSAPSSA
jgi:hypothetical protein